MSNTQTQQQSAAHRLPPEVLIEIFKFAFQQGFGPNVLPLAICKGSRQAGGSTLTIGHQRELIDKTSDMRTLLTLCPLSRQLALNAKPHKLTFATRKTWGVVKKSDKGRHKFYPSDAVFTEDHPGLIYFNGATDIVLLDSVFPPKLSNDGWADRQTTLTIPKSFGADHIQLLHLQSSKDRLTWSGGNRFWDQIIDICLNLRHLYISEKGFDRPMKLDRNFAMFASDKIFDHRESSRIHVVCYAKGLEQVLWGLSRVERTFLPLDFSERFDKYGARAVCRVPDGCRVTDAYEFTIKEITGLRNHDEWMEPFEGRAP